MPSRARFAAGASCAAHFRYSRRAASRHNGDQYGAEHVAGKPHVIRALRLRIATPVFRENSPPRSLHRRPPSRAHACGAASDTARHTAFAPV
ncbi:hypothetical protein BURMUCGD1_5645 [Burkholderia multivorans CGD1]|nr:hypothetical protein BURMUCGD1_5645 [Burkholderia multivorans CGD1]